MLAEREKKSLSAKLSDNYDRNDEGDDEDDDYEDDDEHDDNNDNGNDNSVCGGSRASLGNYGSNSLLIHLPHFFGHYSLKSVRAATAPWSSRFRGNHWLYISLDRLFSSILSLPV